MNTSSYRTAAAQSVELCTNPTLGRLLTAHAVELLEDTAAEEVGDHLLYCLHCRDKYLKIIRVLGPAPGPRPARRAVDAPALRGPKVVSIAEFRRRRS